MTPEEIEATIERLVATRDIPAVAQVLASIEPKFMSTVVGAALFRSRARGIDEGRKRMKQQITEKLGLA